MSKHKEGRKPKKSGFKHTIPSSRNPEYWILKGYSEEESKIMAKSRTPGVYEYYTIYKNMSHDDAIISVGKYQNDKAYTLENLIKKFGEEVANVKWKSYCDKQAISNTFEYKQKRYGWTKEEFDSYNKKRSQTLENMIERHGEVEGTKKWESYCTTQITSGISLQYFQQKYGYLEGKEKFDDVCTKKGHGIEGFIARGHSEEDAIKLNAEWVGKQLDTLTTSGLTKSSKISETFIDDIVSLCELDTDDVYSTKYNGEWFIRTTDGIYFIDFYHKPTGTIIEFFGDYWHGNPRKYAAEHLISYGTWKKTAKELWDKDAIRIQTIKMMPYVTNVLTVWENDYRKNKEQTLELCKNILNGNTTK